VRDLPLSLMSRIVV